MVEAGRSNAPEFDPLNPTPEEQGDMQAGYRDGCAGRPPREDGSLAYAHGRRNGVNDRAHTSDEDQRALAARVRQRRS